MCDKHGWSTDEGVLMKSRREARPPQSVTGNGCKLLHISSRLARFSQAERARMTARPAIPARQAKDCSFGKG